MHHVDYIGCKVGKARLRHDKLSTLKATRLSRQYTWQVQNKLVFTLSLEEPIIFLTMNLDSLPVQSFYATVDDVLAGLESSASQNDVLELTELMCKYK